MNLYPQPLYRDPEGIALYRTEAAGLASAAPGVYEPPRPTCGER